MERLTSGHHPYRDILAEIAREDGVKHQAVQKRMKKGDPATLERIADKIKDRDRMVNRCKRAVRSAGT